LGTIALAAGEMGFDLTWTLIVASTLVAISVGVLLFKDKTRIWDHIARSCLQAAIALCSIALAFFLFNKQTEFQEQRQRRQQISAAVAVLDSIIVPLSKLIKEEPPLYPFTFERLCKNENCDYTEKERQADSRSTDVIIGAELYLSTILSLQESHAPALLAMIRSDPIFSQAAIQRIIDSDSRFSADVKKLRAHIKAFSNRPRPNIFTDSDQLHSRFRDIADIQAMYVRAIADYLCNLISVKSTINLMPYTEAYDSLKISPQVVSFPHAECINPELNENAFGYIEWLRYRQWPQDQSQRLLPQDSFRKRFPFFLPASGLIPGLLDDRLLPTPKIPPTNLRPAGDAG
jgi:hypothetical protein